MSKHPDIEKVRKYLVESGYPEDCDAFQSLTAVEAELARKTSKPQRLSEVLEDMDLIIEQEHGSEFGSRSLKEHLISFRDRLESALAAGAEPVAPWLDYAGNGIRSGDRISHPDGTKGTVVFVHGFDHASEAWRIVYDGSSQLCRLILQIGDKGMASVIVSHAHAQPAAKVEALCSDCPPAGYPTDATRCAPCPRNSPPPASVPDGWIVGYEYTTRSHGKARLVAVIPDAKPNRQLIFLHESDVFAHHIDGRISQLMDGLSDLDIINPPTTPEPTP